MRLQIWPSRIQTLKASHSDLLLLRNLTKCEITKGIAEVEKRGKEQQLKDNYQLEKGHNFHKFCAAVRKPTGTTRRYPAV